MDIIERYIFTVCKRLPAKIREEVEKELHADIHDMLPDDYTEKDVEEVLYKLGNPTELALNYQENKRYLISPILYDNYISVLKLVEIIILCIAPVAAFVSVVTDSQNKETFQMILEIIIRTLGYLVVGAAHAFAWVTLVFAAIDRAGKEYRTWPFTGKPWAIKDLQSVNTTNKNIIKKSEPISAIVFGMIFTAAVCVFPQYAGWYALENKLWNITPLFDKEVLNSYIPFLIGLIAFGIVVAILKLIHQKWNMRLAVINAIHELGNIVFVILFLGNEKIFSTDFLQVLAKNVTTDYDRLLEIWQWSIRGIIVFCIIAMVISAVKGFVLARRTKS